MLHRATSIERASDATIRQLAMERAGRSAPKLGPFGSMGGVGFWRPPGGVPTDGPSNWYRPTSAAHFTALGLNVPDLLYLCQEASGDLSPAIDGLSNGTWTASAGGGHLYQQSVTGWTTKFIGTDGATANQRWSRTGSTLDLSAGESYAMLVYMSFTMPSVDTTRHIIVQGTNNAVLFLSSTGRPRIRWNSVSGTGTTDHSGIDTVHMYGVSCRADTDTTTLETDLESISVTHDESAKSTQIRGLGSSSADTSVARYNWCAIWKGTNAQFSMSSAVTTLKH